MCCFSFGAKMCTPNKVYAGPLEGVKTSGGIRKNLLTPCRRVGLSKKVKTPLTASKATVNGSPSMVSSPLCVPLNSNSDTNKTPVNNKESVTITVPVIDKKCVTNSEEKKPSQKRGKDKVLRNARKCLVLTSQNETNDDSVTEDLKPPKRIKKSISSSSEASTYRSENSSVSEKTMQVDLSCKENLDSDIIANVNNVYVDLSRSIVKNDSNTLRNSIEDLNKSTIIKKDSIITHNLETRKSTVKKRLSMKRASGSVTSTNDSDFEFMPIISSSQKDMCNNIPANALNLETLPLLCEESKVEQIAMKTDLIQPPANVDLKVEIDLIIKRIDEKKRRLDDLRRAEVYQKKHNLEELEKLKQVWKAAATQALYDLLPHLQAHGTIDMATLLKNLNIPDNFVSCSESK